MCAVWWMWFGSLLLGASWLVIALRLIISGDVELNPGPIDQEDQEILSKVDDTTLEEDDWNLVIDECSSVAAKWEQVSGFLGLRLSLIDTIKQNHPGDNVGCWNDALKHWIKHNYNTTKFHEPSWRSLLKAITRVNRALFKKLAAEHQLSVSAEVDHVERDMERLMVSTSDIQESKDTGSATKSPDTGTQPPDSGGAAVTVEHQGPVPESDQAVTIISPQLKKQLRERQCFESEHIMYKFQKLFTSTKKSLRKEKVSVAELVSHLECLGSIKPTYVDIGRSPLRSQLPGLADAKTVDAVMSVIKDYCSFFNYHMVEHIIDEFGTKQDKENMANYKDDFTKYAECCITQCPSEIGKMSEEGCANLFVTLDDSFDNCAVSHLNVFIGNLRKILKIPSDVVLRLCRVNLGSIKLIFQIPLSVQQAIFPLSSEQEAELSSLGVVQLSCGNYQFTPQQTEEVIEEPVTNGDSDHTDSEGTMGSKDSCDAELSSMVAGLAVGKPGDTASISADSALGRSSVITGTTARVTQFSEDLVDRELGDLGMGMGHGVAGASIENELHLASGRGDLKKVKELIEEKQFDPLQKEDQFGMNALHYSAQFGQLRVLKYFIKDRGCSPASQDNRAMTPLHYAAAGKHLDIVRYLVAEQQMDPLCCDDEGDTPLHVASQAGDINLVRYLVNELSKFLPLKDIVTSRGIDGATPIHLAAFNGCLEIVKFFTAELNCDPNIGLPVEYQGRATGLGGRIALHHAACGGHLHIIKYLVEQCSCNPVHLDSRRATPLHMAAQEGHLEVVQYLTLEQNCDPLCTDENNNTPLHAAALCGHLQLVRFFIEVLHCSRDVRGLRNMTPLEQARRRGHHHVVRYLESIYPKIL